ncbi:MAG: dTMP kinase [Synechococcales cyanobacterium M58_A2018_015]|nr:dTMP kinase [Synechococcales cyanobacterium M58_A2018_015]
MPENILRTRPGKLIVFEGVEGCGKTTQIQQTQGWLTASGWLVALQQQQVLSDLVITREPGGTPLGQALRQLLLHAPPNDVLHDRTELLLYAADRAQHVDTVLKPHLEKGALILCDRYTDSTMAYQGYGRGLDRQWIEQLNAIATGGLQSDLTLWLDVDVELGLARAQQRGRHDRIEQAQLDFHQRVQQGFRELAAAHPERIVRIDASLDPAAVSQQIQEVLLRRFESWFR